MTRPELEKQFDVALSQAMNPDKWTARGMQAFALVALAIAVRGLWPEEKRVGEPLGKVPPGGLS